MPSETERLRSPDSEPLPGLTEQSWTLLRDQLERSVARVCPPWLADRRDDLVQVAMMRVMAVLKKSEWKRAQDLAQPRYRVSAESLSRLGAGAELYWQVEAVLADGTSKASRTFVSRLE